MNRWYGKIGFGETVEIRKGVWRPNIVEKTYYGNIESYKKRYNTQSNSTNEDLTIDVQLSIIADSYISLNCSAICYVKFMGARWKVTNVTPAPPRLILTLGGVYDANSNE